MSVVCISRLVLVSVLVYRCAHGHVVFRLVSNCISETRSIASLEMLSDSGHIGDSARRPHIAKKLLAGWRDSV